MWRSEPAPPTLSRLLNEYREYRRAHVGVAESTLKRDVDTVQQFLRHLRRRQRTLDQVALVDIDRFIEKTAERLSTAKVVDVCSSLRAFLRFLHTTGQVKTDLASGVMAPRFRVSERPPAKGTVRLFLSRRMPYKPITSGAIRHRIRFYAMQAGVLATVIGAHAFRHSHASRQVDSGANLKVVSEILGHESCSSTSVYVRVALKRLRSVGLPVP